MFSVWNLRACDAAFRLGSTVDLKVIYWLGLCANNFLLTFSTLRQAAISTAGRPSPLHRHGNLRRRLAFPLPITPADEVLPVM
jgi:hypothetical protein